MASPISRGVPMTLDYRQFLPPASDGRPGQRVSALVQQMIEDVVIVFFCCAATSCHV